MARLFTTKAAQALLEEYQLLQQMLSDLAALPDHFRIAAMTVADELNSNHYFDDRISRELRSETAAPVTGPAAAQTAVRKDVPAVSSSVRTDSARTEKTEQLIAALYMCQAVGPIAKRAKETMDFYAEPVNQAMAALAQGASGLKWVFSGKKVKADANKAFDDLNMWAEETYGSHIREMWDQAEALQQTPLDEVWTVFEKNREVFGELLAAAAPKQTQMHVPAAVLTKILTDYQKLKTGMTSCSTVVEERAQTVRTTAQRMAAARAMEILGEIPVEELNRERGGIRVKTLRDAGFGTIADICAAGVWQLEAISGISMEGAQTIKRLAHDYTQRLQKDTTIRLSTDNRTPEATALVSAVCGYRKKRTALRTLQEMERGERHVLDDAADTMRRVKNGLTWFFMVPDRREALHQAYQVMQKQLYGDFGQTSERLVFEITRAEAPDADTAWDDFAGEAASYYTTLEELVPGLLDSGDGLYGLPEDLAREIQEEDIFPDGLLCTLRRYQEWGVKYVLHQEKVLLGDEMGLGKTIQAIAVMVSLRNTGAKHFVVVCPASVLTNWCREIAKHSRLKVTKVHGPGREAAFEAWKQTGGAAVTTYESTGVFELTEEDHLDLLVADEAHYIKNPEARRTQRVRQLCDHAGRILFMTGTALENRVDEMIALIRILKPEVADQIQGKAFMSTAPQFREIAAPVYYRRKRDEVLNELPELTESDEWCTLSEEEEKQYEKVLNTKDFMAVRRVSWDMEDLSRSCKARRLLELVEEAASEDRKILVFSFFLDTIRGIAGLLGERCYGPITGSVSPSRRQMIVDDFEKAPAGSVLLGQIISGGTGLNIQSASVVILCEPQLKPSTEHQAISRAYRMGQSRNVLVYRLLCDDTIDERIMEILSDKQAAFDAFADLSTAAEQSAELDSKTLGQIIEEEIERIKAAKTPALPEGL